MLLAPLLVYAKGISYPFSPLDEQWLIVNDASFLAKWSYLYTAFADNIQDIYYRPVFTDSLVIDYHLAALNPLMYHISNLVFHLLAIVLLYRLLLLLNTTTITAFMLCLLFSVHPVLVHAVEWIPGRNDSMLCVFSLLAVISLIRYFREKKTTAAMLHVLFFVLALLTKENAVLLPLVFGVFAFIFRPEKKQMAILVTVWLAALAGWYLLRNHYVSYFPSESKHLGSTIGAFLLGLLTFTGKALFPVQQSVTPTPSNSSLIAGIAALLTLIILYIKPGVKDKKMALGGVLMFIILLVLPVWYGALSPLGEQYEHRIYTPMCGLVIFASQLNFKAGKHLRYALTAVALLFAVKTVSRITVYKDDLSYLNEGIADCPQNYVFYSQKANILYAQHNLPQALELFNKAIPLQPKRPHLYQNRGNVYLGLGKRKEAIDDYTKALELSGNNPAVLLTRCAAYNSFGDIADAMSDLQALKKCCSDIIPQTLEREVAGKWMKLQWDTVNEEIAKDPTNAELYVNRAQLYFNRRKGAEALADLKKACELQPGNAQYKAYYEQLKATYKP